MLDFFKDLYLETHGIDSEEAEKERKIKQQLKRKKYILFSGKAKAVIICMALIFLAIQMLQIKSIYDLGIGFFAADILLCVTAIVTVVLLLIEKYKAQVAAAILIAIFVILEYLYMTFYFFLK